VRLDVRGGGPLAFGALRLPLIAHWTGQHFVVVERVSAEWADVIDPALGRRRVGEAEVRVQATGVALEFLRVDEADAGRTRVPGSVRSLLGPVLRHHRSLLARVLVVSLLLTVMGLALPLAMTAVTVRTASGSALPPSVLVLVGALAVSVGLLSWGRAVSVARLQRSLGDQLGGATVERLLAAPYRFFERRDTGDLIARVSSADVVRDVLAGTLVSTLLDATLAVGYLIAVGLFDPVLGVVAGALLIAQLAVALRLSARTSVLRREELLAQASAQTRLVEGVAGIAAVRTSGAESWVLRTWRALYLRQLDASARRARIASLLEALLTAGRVAAPVLLLVVAVRAADPASLGRQLGLAALASAALMPVWALATQARTLAELGPLLDRLADVALAAPEQPRQWPSAPPLYGRIDLEEVGFRYDAHAPFALRNLSLSIAAGSKVGVVGASGSGKSTLAMVLSTLHQASEGRVLVDGTDVTTLELRSLRRQLGVVLQEPFLAGTTIREAIALGHDGATEADIERAARLAAVDGDIAAMPLGYDTPIGEAGRGLSGGQRQRVALARAILGHPAVLILDEATSALDAATEARVEAGLRALRMTRIVVAHRLSTVADADLIVVLDQGRMVECGAPHDLLRQGGRYAAMVRGVTPERPLVSA
jgi:ABC-type bacteriocin/lantibiotic exporter with double-glycine peptidase domain